MALDAPETFWPPAPAELRRWRLRVGAYHLVGLGAVAVPLLALYAFLRVARGGLTLAAHARGAAPLVALVVLLGLGLFLGYPRVLQAGATRILGLAIRRARAALEPGERLEVVCFANWLGERAYAPGFLALTDRRVLRLHATSPATTSIACLARRDGSEGPLTFARAVRRANRNAAARLVLSSMGADQGLWVRCGAARAFLATDRFILDGLVAHLEAAGHEVDFKNDEDEPTREAIPAPTFVEVQAPDAPPARGRLRVVGVVIVVAMLTWLLWQLL